MSAPEDSYSGGAVLGGPVPPTNFDVDPHMVPAEMKHEGPDWFAIFNSGKDKKRTLDVELVHTLMHERSGTLFAPIETCG